MFDVFYFGNKPNLFAHERRINSLDQARQLCNTRFFWIVDYLVDYSGFDFLYEPVPWQQHQRHVWPSQWQCDSGTWLVPNHDWSESNYQHPVVTRTPFKDVIYIDHGNSNKPTVEHQRRTRFVESYLKTLARIVSNLDQEYAWVCSSVCDYSNFDFSWHPEPWQNTMIHVFASGKQKFGDTFYIHVPSAQEQLKKVELLDWANVNFVESISVPRHHMPVNFHYKDSHIEPIQSHEFTAPLEIFTSVNIDNIDIPEICLWRDQTKTITPLSKGASTVIVPQQAAPYIKRQLYDYAYINKSQNDLVIDQEQDVIFISNNEPMSEGNWEILKSICPRARRSSNVHGREAAYKAAAEQSESPWFFAVFAKTEVLSSFDFSFQPDRMQQPKHYIFHSRNPVNGLEYGAMNINLYNRQLVLDTVPGLDFTLSALHTVVPVCASISRFNTDPWITWRSAFRETMKLQREVELGADIEIEHRLHVWCTQAQGENADHCLQGALDGVEYYKSVNGDYDALCLSFDWQWCQDWYYNKYKKQPWLES